jgi:sporulation protein YlmC with PRC-barrel domain
VSGLTEKTSKLMPTQRFVGMQVIDSKGMVVGNVKDVSVNFHDRTMAFLVTAKNFTELDISWDDIMSVEDVVLLKKEIELPKISESEEKKGGSTPVIQAMLICSECGTSAPAHAKFCPKCGHALK